MLRLMQVNDIPQIAKQLNQLKVATAWAAYIQPGYNDDTLTQFLHDQLANPDVVCYVWDDGNAGVAAFCGAALSRFYLPPHMPTVFEWGWTGQGRHAAECWVACKQWGKKRGAELAYRVLARPGSSATCIREEGTWEVL